MKTFAKLHMNFTLRYLQQHAIIVLGQKSRVSGRELYLPGLYILCYMSQMPLIADKSLFVYLCLSKGGRNCGGLNLKLHSSSLIPRPLLSPVFDRLQCAKIACYYL